MSTCTQTAMFSRIMTVTISTYPGALGLDHKACPSKIHHTASKVSQRQHGGTHGLLDTCLEIVTFND